MANNIQYYLNQGEPCTTNNGCCLKKNNHLSEFDTIEDKNIVLENLGISDMITNLVDSRMESILGELGRIWGKFSELTGETYDDIVFTVTPEYYVGENGCDVHITVASGIFEELQIYINGELISSNRNIGNLEQTVHIDNTSVITCKAKIEGNWHTVSKTVTHYDSFWVGAGQTAQEVMTFPNLKPINNGNKSNYNIPFSEGDMLFIIVIEQLKDYFVRADLNGVELPLKEKDDIVIDGVRYKVFCHETPWIAGTYNIDINS